MTNLGNHFFVSLIINHSLEHGTQIPYIRKAKELGYEVLITNTNDVTPAPENSNPMEHAAYVWKHFVEKSKPESVAVVAHSYGGVVAMDLVSKFLKFFRSNVFAIGLSDSVHSNRLNSNVKEYVEKVNHLNADRTTHFRFNVFLYHFRLDVIGLHPQNRSILCWQMKTFQDTQPGI